MSDEEIDNLVVVEPGPGGGGPDPDVEALEAMSASLTLSLEQSILLPLFDRIYSVLRKLHSKEDAQLANRSVEQKI